jgi:ABC-2 type transport system permease protein
MPDLDARPRSDRPRDLAVHPAAGPAPRPSPAPSRRPAARPSARRLVSDQVVHASIDAWRTPATLLVTLVFPLLFLAVSGLAAGASPGSAGDDAIQRLVPGVAVFAIAMATFVMLAFSVALAGEQGVLKRLRGTPLPAWAYLAGRVCAAAWVAVLGTVLTVVVGVVAYGLELTATTLPAALLGLLVSIVVLATLGLGVAILVGSSQAVLSLTMGAVILLGFVSDLYGFDGPLPRWLEAVGWTFPFRHAVEVLAVPLQPGVSGAGVAVGSLAVLLAWGAVGAVVASRTLGRASAGTRSQAARPHVATADGWFSDGSPHPLGMIWGQTRHANRAVWREPVYAFFALGFPTLFVVVLPQVVGNPDIDGRSFAAWMTTGMPVFGIALTAYVALPELVAAARDRGVLKRLRGTPLPAWAYLAGRLLSVAWIAMLTVAIVLLAGWWQYGVAPVAAGWPTLVLVLAVGTACLAALGLAVGAVAPNAEAVPAITLASFMPLVFLSGIFPLGDALPDLVARIAGWLPIAPLVDAVREAFETGALLPRELAIVAGWALLGAAIASSRFRWEP